MDNTSLNLVGILMIILGCILIIKKRIVVKGEYGYIFFMLIALAPSMKSAIKIISYDKTYIIELILVNMIIILPLIIVGVNKSKNTYDIINTSPQMVSSIICSILEEKDISYDKREKTIFLKNYDVSIYCRKSLDTVRLDFKDIKEISFQEEIMEGFKNRIKEITWSIFPATGILFIGLGVALILIDKYI